MEKLKILIWMVLSIAWVIVTLHDLSNMHVRIKIEDIIEVV
jgi:hypothetical protein